MPKGKAQHSNPFCSQNILTPQRPVTMCTTLWWQWRWADGMVRKSYNWGVDRGYLYLDFEIPTASQESCGKPVEKSEEDK